jgi:hypothetical protein
MLDGVSVCSGPQTGETPHECTGQTDRLLDLSQPSSGRCLQVQSMVYLHTEIPPNVDSGVVCSAVETEGRLGRGLFSGGD